VNRCFRYGGLLCGRHREQMRKHGKIQARTISDRNDYIIKNGYCEVVIFNRLHKEKCRTLIDIADVRKVAPHSWCTDGGGYVNNYNLGTLHKFLLGRKEGVEIDHINRDKLDNRRANLRMVSKSINNSNRGTGNAYKRPNGRWSSSVSFKGKQKHLGTFDTKKEAMEVAQQAKDLFIKTL